ncbi:MAG: PAS domain S-box protein [Trebonia sp.]
MISRQIPSAEQLDDLFTNSSVGIIICDGTGCVELWNRAASLIMGLAAESSIAGQKIRDMIMPSGDRDWPDVESRLQSGAAIESAEFAMRPSTEEFEERTFVANAVAGTTSDGDKHWFWIVRPNLVSRLPGRPETSGTHETDARAWVNALGRAARTGTADSGDEGADREELLTAFFENAPAAIHLIGFDGSIKYANPADKSLVGYAERPSAYVGHHVEQIYQDKDVVDDFMSRWGDDSPIINFRANFIRSDGEIIPVVIYSTANADKGRLENTRCFVFNDPIPEAPRDKVSQYSWPSA